MTVISEKELAYAERDRVSLVRAATSRDKDVRLGLTTAPPTFYNDQRHQYHSHKHITYNEKDNHEIIGAGQQSQERRRREKGMNEKCLHLRPLSQHGRVRGLHAKGLK